MAKFENVIPYILNNEGGYLEDKQTGERSNFGITAKLLFAIDYFTKEPKDLTINDAKNIYITQFWQKYRFDLFDSDRVAAKVMDMYVNMGPHQAALTIQKAMNLKPPFLDGILGHFTRGEINEWPVDAFLSAVCGESKKFYTSIAKDEKAKYLNSWLIRAEKVPV
jgi:lysozyme family protein